MGKGLGKFPSKYFIFSIIGLAILGGFLLYNSPDAQAIQIAFPPTSVSPTQEWGVSAGTDALTAVVDENDSTFLVSTANNEAACFFFDTGFLPGVQLNSGAILEVRAEKTIPKGQTKIRLATLFEGVLDEGKRDYRLTLAPDEYTRDFPDVDTIAEVHERAWCAVHQTDAKESHVLKMRLILDVPVDTDPPEITAAADPAPVQATSRLGADVTFGAPTASDAESGLASLTCDKQDGSQFDFAFDDVNNPTTITPTEVTDFFGIGQTTVTCTATDAAGNFATDDLVVTVNPYLAFNQIRYFLGEPVLFEVVDPFKV